MHKTPSGITPPASRPFSACSDTNLHSSLGQKSCQRCQLWIIGSGRARECGTQLTSSSNGSAEAEEVFRCSTLLPTIRNKGYGCPPEICASACPVKAESPLHRFIGPTLHPTFHVSLLKPFSLSSSEPREPDQPLPPP